jgi:hypothetical protein
MKISAQISVILAVIFATICFGVAISGFSSLSGITDPAQHADSVGYSWFWAFLGSVAVLFGALGVWIIKTESAREDA